MQQARYSSGRDFAVRGGAWKLLLQPTRNVGARQVARNSSTDSATSGVKTTMKAPIPIIPGNSKALSKQMKIYSQLSKARLSSLVVMTTSAGFLMAGTPIGWSAWPPLV